MSKLLEVFGRGLNINTADIIWHWLNAMLAKVIDPENRPKMERILELLSEKNFDHAQKLINDYLDKFPDSSYARLAATHICLNQGQIDHALEQLQSIYFREPYNTMALYTLGFCYEVLGDQTQAVEFYQDCIKFKSYLQLPRQRLAAIYLKNGRLEDAIDQYEQIKKEFPDDFSCQAVLGYMFNYNQQYKKAIDAFNTAIALHPDSFSNDNEIAELIQLGQIEQAQSVINSQIKQFGEMPELLIQLVDISLAMGKISFAVNTLNKIIRIQPDFLEAYIKLATIYHRNRNFELATEYFCKAAEINDEIVDAYLGLACSYALSGDGENASSTLEFAASIQQNSNLLWGQTATLKYITTHEHQGSLTFETIIKAHTDWLNTQKDDLNPTYNTGLLYMCVADHDKAIECFKEALVSNELHFRAYNKYIISVFEKGDKAAVLSALKNLTELNRNELGDCYDVSLDYCCKSKLNYNKDAVNSVSDEYQNISNILESLGVIDRASSNLHKLENIYTTK